MEWSPTEEECEDNGGCKGWIRKAELERGENFVLPCRTIIHKAIIVIQYINMCTIIIISTQRTKSRLGIRGKAFYFLTLRRNALTR